MSNRPTTQTEKPVKYSKAKILTFSRFAKRRDLLSALLKDDETYTMDQAEGLIKNFMMKGKVK